MEVSIANNNPTLSVINSSIHDSIQHPIKEIFNETVRFDNSSSSSSLSLKDIPLVFQKPNEKSYPKRDFQNISSHHSVHHHLNNNNRLNLSIDDPTLETIDEDVDELELDDQFNENISLEDGSDIEEDNEENENSVSLDKYVEDDESIPSNEIEVTKDSNNAITNCSPPNKKTPLKATYEKGGSSSSASSDHQLNSSTLAFTSLTPLSNPTSASCSQTVSPNMTLNGSLSGGSSNSSQSSSSVNSVKSDAKFASSALSGTKFNGDVSKSFMSQSSGMSISERNSKKKRTRTTPDQLRILSKAFMTDPMPSSAVRQAIAKRLNMTTRAVQVWFQNRRAKEKLDQKRQETMTGVTNSMGMPPSTLINIPQTYIPSPYAISSATSNSCTLSPQSPLHHSLGYINQSAPAGSISFHRYQHPSNIPNRHPNLLYEEQLPHSSYQHHQILAQQQHQYMQYMMQQHINVPHIMKDCATSQICRDMLPTMSLVQVPNHTAQIHHPVDYVNSHFYGMQSFPYSNTSPSWNYGTTPQYFYSASTPTQNSAANVVPLGFNASMMSNPVSFEPSINKLEEDPDHIPDDIRYKSHPFVASNQIHNRHLNETTVVTVSPLSPSRDGQQQQPLFTVQKVQYQNDAPTNNTLSNTPHAIPNLTITADRRYSSDVDKRRIDSTLTEGQNGLGLIFDQPCNIGSGSTCYQAVTDFSKSQKPESPSYSTTYSHDSVNYVPIRSNTLSFIPEESFHSDDPLIFNTTPESLSIDEQHHGNSLDAYGASFNRGQYVMMSEIAPPPSSWKNLNGPHQGNDNNNNSCSGRSNSLPTPVAHLDVKPYQDSIRENGNSLEISLSLTAEDAIERTLESVDESISNKLSDSIPSSLTNLYNQRPSRRISYQKQLGFNNSNTSSTNTNNTKTKLNRSSSDVGITSNMNKMSGPPSSDCSVGNTSSLQLSTVSSVWNIPNSILTSASPAQLQSLFSQKSSIENKNAQYVISNRGDEQQPRDNPTPTPQSLANRQKLSNNISGTELSNELMVANDFSDKNHLIKMMTMMQDHPETESNLNGTHGSYFQGIFDPSFSFSIPSAFNTGQERPNSFMTIDDDSIMSSDYLTLQSNDIDPEQQHSSSFKGLSTSSFLH